MENEILQEMGFFYYGILTLHLLSVKLNRVFIHLGTLIE
jgi:hypothetical protein